MLVEEIKHIAQIKDAKRFRKFGITIGIFLLIIGNVFLIKSMEGFVYLLLIGGVILICGLIIPKFLRPLFVVWMIFSVLLGFITTGIILSIIFYLIFFPTSVILKIFRKDLLQQKIDPDAESYWILREKKPYDPQSSEKQY